MHHSSDPARGMSLSTRSRFNGALAVMALVAIAFVLRVVPFIDDLSGGHVVFYQPDHYYYLRRALTMIERFPSIVTGDPYFSYPEFRELVGPPFYAFLLACLGRIAGGGEHVLEILSAHATAAAGALAVVPLWSWVRKILPGPWAWGAVFCASIVPLGYWYTIAPAGDHHALEILLALACFASAADVVTCGSRRSSAMLALSTTGITAVWLGSPLYIGLLGGFLLIAGVVRDDSRLHVHRAALALAAGSILAAVLVVAAPPRSWSFRYNVYSLFQPSLQAAIGLGVAGLMALQQRRIAWGAAALAGASVLAVAVAGGAIDAVGFVTGRDLSFLSVMEMRSVLDVSYWKGRFDLAFLLKNVYFATILVPPLIALVMLPKKDGHGALLAYGTVCFAVLGILQRRFAYMYAPFIGVLCIYGVYRLARAGQRACAVIAASLLLACWGDEVVHTRDYFRPLANLHQRSAYRWLRDNAPPPSPRPLDPSVPAAYSILAPWYEGYYAVYFARMPVVANNGLVGGSGRGLDDSLVAVTTPDPATFYDVLDRHRVRYVTIPYVGYEVETYRFLGMPYVPPEARVYGALGLADGMLGGRSLERLRLIHVSPPPGGGQPCKVYEYVRGALLHVTTDPGQTVEASVHVAVQEERIVWRQRRIADASGTAEFRLPYANDGARTGSSPYVVTAAGRTRQIVVGELDVREGRVRAVEMRR